MQKSEALPAFPVSYVAFGSNIGQRERHVLAALRQMKDIGAAKVRRISSLYETGPVGMGEARPFVNGVAEVDPLVSPADLLTLLKQVEANMGRQGGHNVSRTIDLDIIAFGDRRINQPSLQLPHPRYHERGFVLVPLQEIAPEFICPISGRQIASMMTNLDTTSICKISSRSIYTGP